MPDAAQLIAACMVEHARQGPQQEFRGPLNTLLNKVSEAFEVKYDAPIFQRAQEILEELEALHFHLHDGMQAYCVLSSKDFDGQFRKTVGIPLYKMKQRGDDYEALESYAYIGNSWLYDALDTYLREPFKRVEMWGDLRDSFADVPASDRLVSVDHNSSQAKVIDSELEQLELEITRSNEAFVEDTSAREAAVAEISALRRIWSATVVRIDAFKVRARHALTWVAEKSATATVSEMCKRLIQLILGW